MPPSLSSRKIFLFAGMCSVSYFLSSFSIMVCSTKAAKTGLKGQP